MSTVAADPYAPREVWGAYNRALAIGGLQALPDYRFRGLRSHFVTLADFCRANGIDPERWVRAKHHAVGWRFRVRIRHLAKASDLFIANYQDWGAGVQAEAQSQERIAGTVVVDGPGPDGLTILGEAMKRAHATEPAGCLASRDLTGGWSAQSTWCLACPLSAECQGQASVGC